jgi:hypothetical protein
VFELVDISRTYFSLLYFIRRRIYRDAGNRIGCEKNAKEKYFMQAMFEVIDGSA